MIIPRPAEVGATARSMMGSGATAQLVHAIADTQESAKERQAGDFMRALVPDELVGDKPLNRCCAGSYWLGRRRTVGARAGGIAQRH